MGATLLLSGEVEGWYSTRPPLTPRVEELHMTAGLGGN